jgi:hypothetical protein
LRRTLGLEDLRARSHDLDVERSVAWVEWDEADGAVVVAFVAPVDEALDPSHRRCLRGD